MLKQKKYVVTGNVCSGKTTIIDELKKRGRQVVKEVGAILSREAIEDNLPYPQKDTDNFLNRAFLKQKKLEQGISSLAIFLDRSAIDIAAFCKLHQKEFPEGLMSYIEDNRYDKVFFMEPLPFYVKSETRRSNAEKYNSFGKILEEMYGFFGYDLIKVPCGSITTRTSFLLDNISGKKTNELSS